MSNADPRTVGVEEELLLFSGGGTRQVPAGEHLAEDDATEVEHELKLEQAEIATPPSSDLAEVAHGLHQARGELVAAVRERGLRVAALATSPLVGEPTPTPDERYQRMGERYRAIMSDQLACGTHVHVGVASRQEGVVALDGMQPWLPVLVALSANSPFWEGRDTGYASFRSIAWGRWPTAGPTEPFGDVATYDARVEAMVDSGASIDVAMIYFDTRLSATYPTVEFRVCDVGQEVEDEMLLAALSRAAVETAVRQGPGERHRDLALVRAAGWRAARFGLTEDLYDVGERRLRPATEMVDRMLDLFAPALRAAGDEEPVRRNLDRLLARGTGAELQRADLAAGGSPVDVVLAATRRTAGETATAAAAP